MTMPRSRVMAAITVFTMLCVGIAVGIAVDRSMLRRRFGGGGPGRGGMGGPFGMIGAEPPDSATRQRMRHRIISRMRSELDLTPAQERSVDSIFASRELQLDALRSRMRPALDSLRDQMRVAMDSVLTPVQRIKFAEQRKRMDARRGGGRRPDR
jgi:Spy/CpxP family protein refolding chaperone